MRSRGLVLSRLMKVAFVLAFIASLVAVTVCHAAVEVKLGEKPTLVEQTAADEVREYVGQSSENLSILLGTPESSAYVKRMAGTWKLAELGDEGFVVQPIRIGSARTVVVASQGVRGVLYGANDLVDKAKIGTPLGEMRLRDKPALSFRNVWSWERPAEKEGLFFNLKEMGDPTKYPKFRDFGQLLARMHVNSFCFWGRYGEPITDPKQAEIRKAYNEFTKFLRDRYGVDSYFFVIYQVEYPCWPGTGWPLCTHNEKVRQYWKDKVNNLFTQYPYLKGFIIAGAGGDWLCGPWECTCEQCKQHTKRELLLQAMHMIADPMRKYGGRLVWKDVTDRPLLVHTEIENFGNMEGLVPDNVLITHKTFYKDFRPPSPFNPMFYRIRALPGEEAPYVCEFQIFGEYRGQDLIPCSMADRWSELFRLLQEKKETGAIGVCSVQPGISVDHILNGINWYAFGRYAWNPQADPNQVLSDWATIEFGRELAPTIADICRKTYRASMDMMFFKGVMTQNHSKLCTPNYELEPSLIGPWHGMPKNEPGFMGRGHDLSMYPPDVAKQIYDDPSMLLFTHRVPVTGQLADEAIAEKDEAVRLWQEIHDTWKGLEGKMPREKYKTVLDLLALNQVDAKLWRESMALFMDHKAKRLAADDLQQRIKLIESYGPKPGTRLCWWDYPSLVSEWKEIYKKEYAPKTQ